MDTEEINKYIHVEIMGHPNCSHSNISSKDEKLSVCDICGYEFTEDDDWAIPDYCSDDSPRWLLNEVVTKIIETSTRSSDKFGDAIDKQKDGATFYHDGHEIRLTAEQIARACVDAHREVCKHGN